MKNTYIILGYGIPKDILVDENMRMYLRAVFNAIFEHERGKMTTIIFSGGHTDCFKPYRRTEAHELMKLFKVYARRPFVRKGTRPWEYVTEQRSLSTLENMTETMKLLRSRRLNATRLTIFCEFTRRDRVSIMSRKVFKRSVAVIPIDFDTSANRYLDAALLRKKERDELRRALLALRSERNMHTHHAMFAEKIAYLRKLGPQRHVSGIQAWWQGKMKEFER